MRAALVLLIASGTTACTGPGNASGAYVDISVDVQRPHVTITLDNDVIDPGTNTTSHAVSQEWHYDDWKQASGVSHTVSFAGGGVGAGAIVVPGGRCAMECPLNGCDPAKVVWEWSAVVIDKDGNATLDCLRCLDGNSQALFQSCPPAP
jgi:hypothetical protein